MSCKDKIEVFAPSFTPAEKIIAQYLLDNTEQALKQSIHEIAAEVSTSASSLTRFCHKLGYDTFKEMKVDLVPAVDELAADEFRRVMGWMDNSEQLVKNYLMGMNDVCRQALELNSMKSLREIAQLVYRADIVYLFGSGLRRRGKTSAAPWGRLVCGWRPALMRWKGCWIASQILQLWRLQCTDETNSGACRRRGLLPADA